MQGTTTKIHTNDDGRWSSLYAKKLEVETVQAFRYFRSHGVEPILIKGWAAARYYPPGRSRFFSDIDLCVYDSDFVLAEELRTTAEGERLPIDLHRELRHLDSRPWKDIFIDSQVVDLGGCGVRIPCDEDHLRIITTHWLLDGGEHKNKLWDVYFAVENRSGGFNWDKCLGCVSPNRRTWVICTIGAAHRYLGLEIDDLPFADEARALPKWFTDTLESEWRFGTAVRPLTSTLHNPREFIAQVRKRLPPNPIRAMVENEGNMFSGSRIRNQFALILRRARPSLSKLLLALSRGQR